MFRLTLTLFALLMLACPAFAQQVEIRLRAPSTVVSQKTVHISDVAELSGGNPTIRQQLAALDLHEFASEKQTLDITDRLIQFRAVIAGIDESLFTVSGPSVTRIRFSQPVDTTKLFEQTLIDHLADLYQIPLDSFDLQIVSPIDTVLERFGIDPYTLQVTPQFPAELPLGNRSIEVLLSDGRNQTAKVNISARIAVYRDLVMAKENISRGEVISEEKLERVRRPIDNQQIRFASFEQAIGKKAQSDIQQFALVKSQFVRDVQPPSGTAGFDVKRNQTMNIIIRRGPLNITLQDAKAMENGRIGDYIDFMNPKSKERVRARVIDAQTATIEL